MKGVELYGRVRYAVQIEGLSERAAPGFDGELTDRAMNARPMPHLELVGERVVTPRGKRAMKTSVVTLIALCLSVIAALARVPPHWKADMR
jgi:hypothetical protein